MVFSFSGRAHWVNKKTILLMLIIPIITQFFVWTDSIYGLLRYNIHLDTSGPFPVIGKEYGSWFWVHFSYCYLFNFLSVFFLLKTIWQKNIIYRMQSVFLLIGIVLIIASNLLYVTGMGPIKHYDISPIIFSVSGAIIAWGIFRFRLINLAPIARDSVIDSIENIVITLDATDRIIDTNPAAKKLFPVNYHHSLAGKSLNQLSKELADLINTGNKLEQHRKEFIQSFKSGHRHYEIFISPIKDYNGVFKGRAIVINDTTELREAQEELSHDQKEIAVMAERERMAKDLHDNLGQILSFAGIQIQAAQMERQRGNHEIADSYLKRLGEIIEETHGEMRNYVYNTRENEYKQASIKKLLKNQIRKFVENSNFTWEDILLKLNDYEFTTEIKMQLVNIVKEALNNIIKHAEATTLRVALRFNGESYELIIEDNGVGFRSNLFVDNKTGSGLSIIADRAQLIDGNMKIVSIPGEITRISIIFPGNQGGNCNENNDS